MFEFLGYFFAAWCGLSLLGIAGFCWAASRRRPAPPPAESLPFVDDEGTRWLSVLPPVPPSRRRPERLEGFELDAAFYAVLAPSFREYH